VTSQPAGPVPRPPRTTARPALAAAALPAAAGIAVAAGLALGWAASGDRTASGRWAASGPAALLAGHGPAGPARGAVPLAIGVLAVLLAGANGFAKAYSP
jgi:hypothetical protein